MSHKRRAQAAIAHAFGRRRPRRGVNPFRPRSGLAVREPLNDASAAVGRPVRRIVEVLAVEVVGNRPAIKRHRDCGPSYLSPAACAFAAARLVAGAPDTCAGSHFRTDVPPVTIGWMSGPKKMYG